MSTATAAARQLRAQDLAAHEAMRHAKPATLRAAAAIQDAGQLFHADVLVLIAQIQKSLERNPSCRALDKNILGCLDDIQSNCIGEIRADAEWHAADDWSNKQ